MARTSLGVDPGLTYTEFVFGDEAEVVRVRFRHADNLHTAESFAQQNLDFVRKLYLEQSSPGEYFEEIHLATEIELGIEPEADSTTNAQTAFDNETDTARHAGKSPALRREAMDLLFEHLQNWISVNSIPLTLLCHDDIAIASQKRKLSLHKPLTEFSIHDRTNVGDALALWSFAFAKKSEPIRPSETRGQIVDYETLSEHFIDQYLPAYKRDLVTVFSEMTYPNEDIEDERRILLNLANDQDSRKFELLNYQERISGMLKKHMQSIATTSENPQREVFMQTGKPGQESDAANQARLELMTASPDVGLFDIEAIDNAERIWSEINLTIERNRKREAQKATEQPPAEIVVADVIEEKPAVTERSSSKIKAECNDEPPMFELEAKAIPTGFLKHNARRAKRARHRAGKKQTDDSIELSTQAPVASEKQNAHQNNDQAGTQSIDQAVDKAIKQPSTKPAKLEKVAISPSPETDQSAIESDGTKHNDFFSSPTFAVGKTTNQPTLEEPELPESKPVEASRNEAWYLPVIAVVAVAGIYFFIK